MPLQNNVDTRLNSAFDEAGIGIALVAKDGRFLQSNDLLARLLGLSETELLASNDFTLTHVEDRDKQQELLSQLLLAEIVNFQIEKRYQHKHGHFIWVVLNAFLVRNNQESPYFIFQIQDISARKLAEAQLASVARTDPLTGLGNRAALEYNLIHILGDAAKCSKLAAVVFLDIDHFKHVNELAGQETGDLLLRAVADRLRAHLRKNDFIARLGGDEFAIILTEITQKEKIAAAARKILSIFMDPFIVQSREFLLTPSMGISVYPENGKEGHSLIRHADAAMRQAKTQGGNNYQFATLAVNPTNVAAEIETILRNALSQNRFQLLYQPQVDLRTRKIVSIEALLRLQHPNGYFISPADFIPIAEEKGLMLAIEAWVIYFALWQLKQWREKLQIAQDVAITINLSSYQFQNLDLINKIKNNLSMLDLSADCLELDIPKNVIMQNLENNAIAIDQLKQLGVKIAIDDFGIAYSSLNYLKRFNLDKLKIDNSFIRNLPADINNAAVISAIIAMAHTFGIRVIAEGVENKEQLNFLITHQCDEAQGYYFSKPLAAADMATLLKTGLPSTTNSEKART